VTSVPRSPVPGQASEEAVKPDHVWTDSEGDPLGGWVVIDRDEWRRIVESAGGLMALGVFSALTDPEGCYGEPQIYTAWGHRDQDVPLVDIRDTKFDGPGRTPERQVFRRWVSFTGRASSSPEGADQ
jgi:hypothetical protein